MATSSKKASAKKEQPAQRGHKRESEVAGHGAKRSTKKAVAKKSAAPEVEGHLHKKGVSRRGIDLDGHKR